MVNRQAGTGPRVHDLVRLNTDAVAQLSKQAAGADQAWVSEALATAPWAVIRRARPNDQASLAIGIRGKERHQRWAAEVEITAVTERVTVNEARGLPIHRPQLKAFQALTVLDDQGFPMIWGPGGSVGFELVTGAETVRESSDVDLILYAPLPLEDAAIKAVDTAARAAAEASGTRIDILVETPSGGVVFPELARSVGLIPKPTVMLRTSTGPELVNDPWS